MKIKTIVIAIVCLLAGYIAGQAGTAHQCDDRVAAAIQDTSDATLAACERKIDKITFEYKEAYAAGFNDCQAQF